MCGRDRQSDGWSPWRRAGPRWNGRRHRAADQRERLRSAGHLTPALLHPAITAPRWVNSDSVLEPELLHLHPIQEGRGGGIPGSTGSSWDLNSLIPVEPSPITRDGASVGGLIHPVQSELSLTDGPDDVASAPPSVLRGGSLSPGHFSSPSCFMVVSVTRTPGRAPQHDHSRLQTSGTSVPPVC